MPSSHVSDTVLKLKISAAVAGLWNRLTLLSHNCSCQPRCLSHTKRFLFVVCQVNGHVHVGHAHCVQGQIQVVERSCTKLNTAFISSWKTVTFVIFPFILYLLSAVKLLKINKPPINFMIEEVLAQEHVVLFKFLFFFFLNSHSRDARGRTD